MVLRNRRWQPTVLAAACIATASTVFPAAATGLAPMDGNMPTLSSGAAPAGPPAGRPRGDLVWGVRVPAMPQPGQSTVYVPSFETPAPVQPAPPAPRTPGLRASPPRNAELLPPIGAEDESVAALESEPYVPDRGLPVQQAPPVAGAPSGYRSLPEGEAMCRKALARLGAQFSEAGSVRSSNACGVPYALKVHTAARGIAMQPPATLNCRTALAVARWLDEDVRSAARWRLLKNPTGLINASSYRCSRIAGSRTVSEHAGGNALDVAGFRFSDGSTVRVEPKGFFRFRERGFQNSVRQASCRHFGTVLGPGYNRAHDDHFHLDLKARMRPVCK